MEKSVAVCSFCWKDGTVGVVFYESVKCTASITVVRPTEFTEALGRIVDMCLPTHFLVSERIDECILNQLAEYETVTQVPKSPSYFSFKRGVDAINSLFFTVPEDEQEQMRRDVASGIIDVSSKSVVGAIGAIIAYVKEEFDDQVTISLFKSLNIPHGLVLTKKEMYELQIFSTDMHPSIHNPLTSKEGLSLFSYMNRCATPMGRLVLREWFMMTNSDMKVIQERLDTVEKFIQPSSRAFVDELTKKIHKLPEIRQIVVRLRKGTMHKNHWTRLYNGLVQAATLCEYVFSSRILDGYVPGLALNQNASETLREVASQIEEDIDFTAQQQGVRVKDANHPQLAELRKNYGDMDNTMTYVAKNLIGKLPTQCLVSSLSVVYIPQQGFLCAMSKSEPTVSTQLPTEYRFQFETDTHVYCKHPATDELDRDIGDIYQDILDSEIKILVALANRVLRFSHIFQSVWDAIGAIDALCALAIVAVEANYTKPRLIEERNLKIIRGRHPLLERMTSNFVPNDTDVSSTGSRIHVITGPNSSGKSVYIRQVALIVYMAHIGSFVPADVAEIPLTDRIYALFHGNQEASRPFISSFTAEMKTVAEITGTSTGDSLVIMDEMGKMANHEDGSSILAGFIRYMHSQEEKCPIILATTHFYSVLKPDFLPSNEYIPCTMTVRMDDNFTFLYKMVRGVNTKAESDFGLRCAIQAGLSQEIVERAKVIAQCYEKGAEIPPNPNCTDEAYEQSVRNALTLFFNWNGTNPRALLSSIESTLIKR